ncbi:thiol peroxidase [Dactylosporangium sp. NPDC051485]|uniref:thiol peroxidase n=1 Tax=Dactylosporangium sp. NPDC051485 TaxID=3154846 RepID=UPI0034449249
MTITTVRRGGVVTFRGNPVTLLGEEVQPGTPAPGFTVIGADMAPHGPDENAGRVRLISSVPSLDTDVCDSQTRRFHEELAGLDGVSVWTVSVDLPMAQRRWCATSGLTGAQTFSDHRDLSFGLAYGVVVEELRMLARAVFVIGRDNQVTYAQYVPEVGEHPDYAAAVAAVRAAL